MKDIKLTSQELKAIIDNNKLIGKGYYGAVVEYGNELLKIDVNIYDALKDKDKSKVDYELIDYYTYVKNDFQDRHQIEELDKRQKDVKLTQLPRGIVTLKSDIAKINGISPAIITYYHRNHDKLENLNPKDHKRVLIILKKLLLATKELEENEISQNDLIHYEDYDAKSHSINVLYQNDTPQIIDTSGMFVEVGERFHGAENMYRDLSNIIIDYFYLNGFPEPSIRYKITSYEENCDMVKEFEERTRKL